MLDSTKNPYVGLRPYHSNESIYFFGREAQTTELLQRLHNNNFVAIVGSSGCGKSSLLRAGLIPAIKGGFLVEDSNKWEVFIMKPGESPMYNLAEALLREGDKRAGKDKILAFIKKVEEGGVDAILEHFEPLRKKNINFFLLVDQFEELFAFTKKKPDDKKKTLADSKNEAIHFVNVLLELAEQSVIPFYVVFTMRSDFIGDCAEYYGLPEAMNKSQYLVPRLNRQQLKKVIEGPAKLTGKKFNGSLTSKLLNNLGDTQDELPILQHCLMCMWEFDERKDKENKGEIDFADYEGVGGLEKALSNHAQEALDLITSDEDKEIARALFRALTTIDGSNRKIRRQVRLKKLLELTGASEEKLLEIIDRFNDGGRSFLVIEDVGEFDDKLIDISHESLIRQWKVLSKLVTKEARDAKQYKALSEKQKQYRVGDRELLEGIEYEKAQDWWNTFKPVKTWALAYDANYEYCKDFLLASKKKYDQKKNIRKTTRIGLPALVVIAAIIFGFNYFIKELEEDKKQLTEDLKTRDDNLWITANEENTLLSYKNYLFSLPDGRHKEAASDSLNDKYDALWQTASALNTVDSYENYLNAATDSLDEKKDPPVPYYSGYAQNWQDALDRIKKGALEEQNDPWTVALKLNTVAAYIDYFMNVDNEAQYMQAVEKLSEKKKGWLFCGRKNSDSTKIVSDRVFNLVYRKSSFKTDDMLKPEDIIQLRGKAHRKIREGKESKSATVGTVRENINYFVSDVEIMGSSDDAAVFVQIIIE